MDNIFYIDTNIFLRFIVKDGTSKLSQSAYKIFKSIEKGEITAILIESIFTEICYVLGAKRQPYKLSNKEISLVLTPLLKLHNIKVQNKEIFLKALKMFSENEILDIEDALLIAYMEKDKNHKILSFDKDFDKQKSYKILRNKP